jgi:hypothetical protein
MSSAPTTNLCSAGTASAVIGSGPWRWNCISSDGGTTTQCSAPVKTASLVQKPGPSADLFANPYYTCVNNYYIASSGSDYNDGSLNSPWRTLRHADSVPRAAGDCINVAPGAYSGMTIRQGGNAATSTGYVVYRCQTLDGCTINGDAGVNRNAAFFFSYNGSANFVMLDGFVMAQSSNSPYGQGVEVWNGTNGPAIASHHVWVLNSIIQNFTQTGVQLNAAEYFYVIHNTITGNSHSTCDAQGSGISLAGLHPLPSYMPTADDKTNPNPLIGSFVDGASFFHNVISWNVVHDNALTQCGTASQPYDTDGNGIIMDTNNASGGDSPAYIYQTLISFNVVYNNGGGGDHIFFSDNVTSANNTLYKNQQDPFNSGSARSEADTNGGSNNIFINNLAVGVPATSVSDPRCKGTNPCTLMNIVAFIGGNGGASSNPDRNNAWSNNTSIATGSAAADANGNAFFNNDVGKYVCPSNRCNTDPLYVNPAAGNFALQAGSPALGLAQTKSYLPSWVRDAGACDRSFASCP